LRYHVMIVDDEPTLVTLIHRFVTRLRPGTTVTTLGDGLAALHAYERQGADLIITDCRMPRMDGPSLTRHLRACLDPVPIIMISGDDGNAETAYAAGVSAFLEVGMFRRELPALLDQFIPL
jgi:CheY-like chemotaxis protein